MKPGAQTLSASESTSLLGSSVRLHGLDLFRVALLLLGFLFHSAIFIKPFMNFHAESQFIQHMIHTSILNRASWDAMVWMHLFRMPAFFMLAGFFAHFLLQKYGYANFLLNRCKRILVPLVVVLVVFNLLPILSMIHMMPSNHLIHFHNPLIIWFLEFLIAMEVLFVAVMPLCNKYCLPIIFCLSVVSLMLTNSWFFSVPFETHFKNVLIDFLYYSCFFVVGSFFANHKRFQKLRNIRGMVTLLFISMASSLLYFTAMKFQTLPHIFVMASILHALFAWSMSVGLMMLCVIVADKANSVVRYLADSSYFLYLSQISIIIFFVDIYSAVTTLWFKFLLIFLSSLVTSVLAYHWFIRHKRWSRYIDGSKQAVLVNDHAQ